MSDKPKQCRYWMTRVSYSPTSDDPKATRYVWLLFVTEATCDMAEASARGARAAYERRAEVGDLDAPKAWYGNWTSELPDLARLMHLLALKPAEGDPPRVLLYQDLSQ